MRCVNHSERDSVFTCSHCGREFCAECLVEVNGRQLCKECVAALAGKPHMPPRPHGPREEYYGGSYKYERGRKGPGKFLLFILSLVPGLGYMYLGLIKRGLCVMAALFLNIYLMVEFGLPILAFAIPVIFFASFFDGFKILRAMQDGIEYNDNVDDIVGFVTKNKTVIGIVLAIVVGLGIINNVIDWGFGFMGGYGHGGFGFLPTLALIGAGIYFFFIRGKGRGVSKRHYGAPEHREERYEDHYNDNDNQQ